MLFKEPAERRAVNVFECGVGCKRAFQHAGVQDALNIWVLQPLTNHSLALVSLVHGDVAEGTGERHLENNVFTGLDVDRMEGVAHAASSKPIDDPVPTNRLPHVEWGTF